MPEDLEPSDPVDARRLLDVLRNRLEELHHQENPDGHRHARQDQRVIAVMPTEIGEHRVKRDKDRLFRHHQPTRQITRIARLNGNSSRASA